MNRSIVPAVDIVLAVLTIGLAVLCWNQGVHHTHFPAAGEVPAYTGTRYVGPWLFLSVLLAAGAGIALLDAGVRIVRPVRRA